MSREEYMKQLAYLLQDLPEEEREEALSYYEDYFDEAGPEKEKSVLENLGSPEKVAAIIREGLAGGNDQNGEYTESGYQDERFNDKNKVPEPRDYAYEYKGTQKRNQIQGVGKIILIGILCIFAIPVLSGVFGVLAGIIGMAAGLLAAICVGMVAALILGVIFTGLGIAQLFASPGFGLFMLGAGLLAIAIGLLLLLACMWGIGKFLPWLIRGGVALFRKIFRRGGSKV